jgi:hypothetical protein
MTTTAASRTRRTPGPGWLVAVLLLPSAGLAGVPAAAGAGEDAGYVAYPCPIQGQDSAVVLGVDHGLQSACLALSRPSHPGPWMTDDGPADIDGSSRFCPRPVLTVLDATGAMTVRFLQAEEDSFLADPTACCRPARILSDPDTGQVKIAGASGPNCLDGTPAGGRTDIYLWNGIELTFKESLTEDAAELR